MFNNAFFIFVESCYYTMNNFECQCTNLSIVNHIAILQRNKLSITLFPLGVLLSSNIEVIHAIFFLFKNDQQSMIDQWWISFPLLYFCSLLRFIHLVLQVCKKFGSWTQKHLTDFVLQRVRSVIICSFSCLYFPVIGLNPETCILNIRIPFKCGKTRTRKTPNMDTFHAVLGKKRCFFTVECLIFLFELNTGIIWSRLYSGSCQISKVKHFVKIGHRWFLTVNCFSQTQSRKFYRVLTTSLKAELAINKTTNFSNHLRKLEIQNISPLSIEVVSMVDWKLKAWK